MLSYGEKHFIIHFMCIYIPTKLTKARERWLQDLKAETERLVDKEQATKDKDVSSG